MILKNLQGSNGETERTDLRTLWEKARIALKRVCKIDDQCKFDA